jgi:hypothetical protein
MDQTAHVPQAYVTDHYHRKGILRRLSQHTADSGVYTSHLNTTLGRGLRRNIEAVLGRADQIIRPWLRRQLPRGNLITQTSILHGGTRSFTIGVPPGFSTCLPVSLEPQLTGCVYLVRLRRQVNLCPPSLSLYPFLSVSLSSPISLSVCKAVATLLSS